MSDCAQAVTLSGGDVRSCVLRAPHVGRWHVDADGTEWLSGPADAELIHSAHSAIPSL